MLDERQGDGLEQGGHRPVQRAAEGEPNGEVEAAAQVDFAGQCDVAVGRRGEVIGELEVAREILPAVGGADVAARAGDKRRGRRQGEPGAALVRGEKLAPGDRATLPLLPQPPTSRCGATST
jgi:hypothetical protein